VHGSNRLSLWQGVHRLVERIDQAHDLFMPTQSGEVGIVGWDDGERVHADINATAVPACGALQNSFTASVRGSHDWQLCGFSNKHHKTLRQINATEDCWRTGKKLTARASPNCWKAPRSGWSIALVEAPGTDELARELLGPSTSIPVERGHR
jgi:hypothetical protein